MPTNEPPESSEEEKKPKRSWVKRIIFLIVLLVIVGGAGAGGYWWLFLRSGTTFKDLLGGGDKNTETQSQDGEKSKKEEKKEDKNGLSPKPVLKPVSLPSFTVNLADPSGNKYLRIGMDVELNSQEAITNISAQSARVRDAIILLLSNKTSEELSSAEGKVLLKNEVAARLNQILGTPQVARIYFTDFVIQ